MNTAVLPSAPQLDKNSEITPDPEVLAQVAYVVVVKPTSGVVNVYDKAGRVVARYFDEEFARAEFGAAGLDFDGMSAGQRLKQEDEARRAAKRKLARPDRRLRHERQQARQAAPLVVPPAEPGAPSEPTGKAAPKRARGGMPAAG